MNADKTTGFNRILIDDTFLIAIGHYLHEKQNSSNDINFLTEKKYTIKDTGSTYRVINHWSTLGLLEDVRIEEGKGWRKFSLVDMVWLKVLGELRGIGLSLEKIKTGYHCIKENAAIFECGVALCMMRKGINLIVFSDGHIEVIPRIALTLSESINYLKETSYLVVSLNRCLEQIIPGKSYLPPCDTFELSKKEIAVLSALRSDAYDEVTILMKNGALERINTKTKYVGEIGKLANILNKVTNGDFIIKKQAGKIVFTEVLEKEML